MGMGEESECWDAPWVAGGEVMLSMFMLLEGLRPRVE
jgi:hypothetical protein